MGEIIVQINRDELLKGCLDYVGRQDLVPSDCPDNKCLQLGEISIPNERFVDVKLKANPPRLPGRIEGHLWETYKTCRSFCTIMGDNRRCIRIRFVQEQDNLTPSHALGEW